MMARYMRSEVRQLVSWIESLDVIPSQVAEVSADQLGSALSKGDPPRGVPTSVHKNVGDLASRLCVSPVSFLSTGSSAPESSVCVPENHQERTEEVSNPSKPLDHGIEHEKIALAIEPTFDWQEASEYWHVACRQKGWRLELKIGQLDIL
jgi:hypothetical protein